EGGAIAESREPARRATVERFGLAPRSERPRAGSNDEGSSGCGGCIGSIGLAVPALEANAPGPGPLFWVRGWMNRAPDDASRASDNCVPRENPAPARHG